MKNLVYPLIGEFPRMLQVVHSATIMVTSSEVHQRLPQLENESSVQDSVHILPSFLLNLSPITPGYLHFPRNIATKVRCPDLMCFSPEINHTHECTSLTNGKDFF